MSNCCDSDLLAEIYRGAKMGSESIETVLRRVDDERLRDELLREQQEYRAAEQKARREIEQQGDAPEPLKRSQVVGAHIGIEMNTALDCTASHIADIMIKGNNMGIIGISKSLNNHKNSTPAVRALGQELIDIQQRNIEQLRGFLS